MGSLNMSMLQLAVPPELRGRVMSISWTVHGLMPVAIIPIAWLAEAFSIRTAMLVSALLVGGSTLLFRLMYPEVAKVRSGHSDHLTLPNVATQSQPDQRESAKSQPLFNGENTSVLETKSKEL